MNLGILGAGQLGRMLAHAALPLGVRCRVFDEPGDEAPPAAAVAEFHGARFDDADALGRFAHGLDACTLEFENVPVGALERVAAGGAGGAGVPVFPGPLALATAQDRALEKACFTALGIPTTRFELADSRESLARAVAGVGTPCIVKTRRLGYDGKGQHVLRDDAPASIDAAWHAVSGRPCIVEEFVPFECEVSIIGARGRGAGEREAKGDGGCVFFPLSRNEHRAGILRVSRAPADVDPALQHQAEAALRRLMEHLDYIGVLTVEFFVAASAQEGAGGGGPRLIANEMAPRVHNSGHWTIEGSSCSQFEAHLRAVCGLPLHPPECRPSAMVNLIGAAPSREEVLRIPGARLHLYGKSPRPGRKVGHVTLVGASMTELEPRIAALRALADAAERSAAP